MNEQKTLTEILDDADQMIRSKMEQRTYEIHKLRDRISAENARKKKAEDSATAALTEGNESQFSKQTADAQSAAALIGMIENRIKSVEEQDLISPEELESVTRQIISAFDAERISANSKLRKLAEEMDQIGKDLTEIQSRTNEILRRIQHDLNRDREIQHRNNHGTYYKSADPLSVTASNLIYWSGVAVRDFNYSGTLVKQDKIWGRG